MYDSLYRELSNEHKEHLYTSSAAMLPTSERNMIIEWPSMVQQSGTADCGMFALAVAISLCNGDDPSTQAYDQRVMSPEHTWPFASSVESWLPFLLRS